MTTASTSRMTEADEQLAKWLREDLEPVLGPGIVLTNVQLATGDRAVVQLVYRVDDGSHTLEIEAPDVLEAYQRAIKAAAEVRLALAWSRIVGRT